MTRAVGTLSPMFITTINTTLSQSTPSQNVLNNLTLIISSYSAILPATVQFILSGLILTDTSDSNQYISLSCDTNVFGMNGTWNKSTGTLTFQSVGMILAGQNYTLCFLLKNPGFGQDSPAISIEIQALVPGANNASSVSKRLVGKGSGNSAPLLVVDFLNVSLGQSTTSNGIANTITATLVPRATLLTTAVVTISGLFNASADIGPIALVDASSDSSCGQPSSCQLFFSSASSGTPGYGSWTGDGSLVLYVVSSIMPNTSVKFSFSVTNPNFGQFSPSISIQSNGLDAITNPVAVSKDAGNRAPLAIAGFYTPLMSQSTPSQGVSNTLTVSLWPYTTLPANTSLTISNLQGISLPSTALTLSDPIDPFALAACSPQGGCSKIFSDSAGGAARRSRWDNQSKTLTAALLSDWNSTTLICFSFAFTNPLSPQSSPDISVSSSGINGIVAPLILFKDTWNSAPLLIAGFNFKQIRQSTSLNHAVNTIYVNCSLNVRLLPSFPIYITVKGLTGSETADSKSLALDMSGSDILFSNVSWTRTNGTLVAPMRRSRNDTLASFTFSFLLQNPSFGQVSPPVYISMSGINVSPVLMDPGFVDVLMPLFVNGFNIYRIGQSSSQAFGANTISVTLQSTISLRSTGSITAQITISGLVNTTQPTGVLPLVDRNGSAIFSPTVGWDQVTGTALITVLLSNTLVAFNSYILSFTVLNPAYGSGVIPTIMATGSTIQESFDLLPMTVTPGPEYCLIIIRFGSYSIGQSTPSAGALNLITVTFSTSVTLATGTLVKISNLTSTTTSDGLLGISEARGYPNLGQNCSWNRTTGTLSCTVLSNTLPFVDYTISFMLQNPLLGQESPNVFIETSNPMPIAPLLMLYGSGNAAPLLIARFVANGIEQSTCWPGALNTIRASFALNVALSGSLSDVWIVLAGQGRMMLGVPVSLCSSKTFS